MQIRVDDRALPGDSFYNTNEYEEISEHTEETDTEKSEDGFNYN